MRELEKRSASEGAEPTNEADSTGQRVGRRTLLGSVAAVAGSTLVAGRAQATDPGPDPSPNVGIRVGTGQSVQDAYYETPRGTKIRIDASYDPSVESFPIVLDQGLAVIEGDRSGQGRGNVTIDNGTGRTTFHVNPDNERGPGVTLRDLSIVQSGGGNGVCVENAKFNRFENVHVDANNRGNDDAWFFGDATQRWENNSQVLVGCSAEQAGRDGFQLGAIAHDVTMLGCTALDCGRMGVYVNGPYSVRFGYGQLEDNAEAGLRARVADVVGVHDSYLEANGADGSFGDEDIIFDRTSSGSVSQCWFHGRPDTTSAAVAFRRGSPNGFVRSLKVNDEYAHVVRTNARDTEIMSSSHDRQSISTRLADVRPGADKVRSFGTIVGSGTDNGGNDDLNGVDLGWARAYPGDVAISNGDGPARDGAVAVWRDGTWLYNNPDGTISP